MSLKQRATATVLTLASLSVACNSAVEGEPSESRRPTPEEMQSSAVESRQRHSVGGVVQVPRAGTAGEAADSCTGDRFWNDWYWWGYIHNNIICFGSRGTWYSQFFPFIGQPSVESQTEVECSCVEGGGGGDYGCPNNPPYCTDYYS